MRALPVVAAVLLTGCWEVLSHQDQETVWMEWNGTVEVAPSSLDLSATTGEQAIAELVLTETSGTAGIEIELVVEGDAAEQIAIDPGEFSLGLTPEGVLTVQVTYAAPGDVTAGTAELIATTTGSPAEIRIPIQVSSTAP